MPFRICLRSLLIYVEIYLVLYQDNGETCNKPKSLLYVYTSTLSAGIRLEHPSEHMDMLPYGL